MTNKIRLTIAAALINSAQANAAVFSYTFAGEVDISEGNISGFASPGDSVTGSVSYDTDQFGSATPFSQTFTSYAAAPGAMTIQVNIGEFVWSLTTVPPEQGMNGGTLLFNESSTEQSFSGFNDFLVDLTPNTPIPGTFPGAESGDLLSIAFGALDGDAPFTLFDSPSIASPVSSASAGSGSLQTGNGAILFSLTEFAPVPEPSSVVLLSFFVFGICLRRDRTNIIYNS